MNFLHKVLPYEFIRVARGVEYVVDIPKRPLSLVDPPKRVFMLASISIALYEDPS